MSVVKTVDQAVAGPARSRTIVVVGGGVIGSYTASLAARLSQVHLMRLIDGDTYSASNLRCQAITAADVGRPKVYVLARQLQRQSPNLLVEPIFNWVEQVPWGLLRADVVLCCVDSRHARAAVNRICWQQRIPVIDAGVDGAGLLARTNVYMPGLNRPCLECGWNETDYQAMRQSYACLQGAGGAAASNAPGSLGSIAAGLQVNACAQLLNGEFAVDEPSRQVLWNCRDHRCLVTHYTVNPGCRFDHAIWQVEPLCVSVGAVTLGEFCAQMGGSGATPVAIRVAGQHFVRRLVCGGCRAVRDGILCLDRTLTPGRLRCRSCRQVMSVSGFHAAQWLTLPGALPGRHLRRALASIGLQAGDLVTVQEAGAHRHFELVVGQ